MSHVILTASSSCMWWHRVTSIICYDTIPSNDIAICDELRRDIMRQQPQPTSLLSTATTTSATATTVAAETTSPRVAIKLISLHMTSVPLSSFQPFKYDDIPVKDGSGHGVSTKIPCMIASLVTPFEQPLKLFISDTAFDRLLPVPYHIIWRISAACCNRARALDSLIDGNSIIAIECEMDQARYGGRFHIG